MAGESPKLSYTPLGVLSGEENISVLPGFNIISPVLK